MVDGGEAIPVRGSAQVSTTITEDFGEVISYLKLASSHEARIAALLMLAGVSLRGS